MRLKQLLSLLMLLLVCVSVAAATGAQLTNVAVMSKGNTTAVTLNATGTFTHNEYRPEDKVLLVDLTGVAANSVREKQKALDTAALKGYRVLSYRSAGGTEVTRIEFSLGEKVTVSVNDASGQVQLQLVSSAPLANATTPKLAASVTTEPKIVPAKLEQSKPTVTEKSNDRVLAITHVGVQRTSAGMAVEIAGSNSARTIRLSNPERIVIDFPGAVPALRNRNIAVNTPEIKSIRVARFQAEPPVTRVVIDLASSFEYEVSQAPSKLIVKLTGKTGPAGLATKTGVAPAERPQPVLSASVTPAAVPVPKETRTPETSTAPVPVPPQTKPEPVLSASAKPETTPMPKEDRPVEPLKSQSKPTPSQRASVAASTIGGGAKPIQQAAVLATPGPAQNLASIQQQGGNSIATAPKYTGEPISINVKDVDLKDFFRLVNEISGLNIVIDPNVKGTVSMVLNDVPWDQALDIVLRNNGLDRQLDGNVLRIAAVTTLKAEADARRAQVEAQAQAVERQTVTRFLSYSRANEVAPTVKKFLTPRGEITADVRTNSLIISDIPTALPEIDRILGQLDRKAQQVEIEARVVAANRSYVRDLGVQLGFAWANTATAIGGAPKVGQSPLTVTTPNTPPYFTNNGQIPLFSSHPATDVTTGLVFNNIGAAYRIDTILTMAESRGLIKILSRPRVVTQNNVQAMVRQGVHVPIVTQAQLGGPPTTSYVDAFLKLSVTPQITVENTIFMSVDVENTTPDFSQGVGGNPTLLTQQATTQVLVGDGGTVVIGGVIQTQNSTTVEQTPLLGDIPVLGNLFKRRQVKTSTNELIFFISPRIVQM